jgi:hypothetical protein
VIHAPAPARLIEGGLPTDALVADVLVRQAPIYQGMSLQARPKSIYINRNPLVLG